jgi:hypothetical protein
MPDVSSASSAEVTTWVAIDQHKLSLVAATLPARDGQPEVVRLENTELVRLYRAGERCARTATRHRVVKQLLRHGHIYREGKAWTQRHQAWLASQRLSDPLAGAALEHMLCHLVALDAQIVAIDQQLEQVAATESWVDPVRWLCSFRGIATRTALGLLAEIGDFRRFASPRELMSYLGLTPSEYSSGQQQHRGHITKTGSRHARRLLIEAAWHYDCERLAGFIWAAMTNTPLRDTDGVGHRQVDRRGKQAGRSSRGLLWPEMGFGCPRLVRRSWVSLRRLLRLEGARAVSENAWHARLAGEIAQIHKDSGGTYGTLRVTAELRYGRGIHVGKGQVHLLTKRLGIYGLPKRRLPRGAKVGEPSSLDLVRRRIRGDVPDRLWTVARPDSWWPTRSAWR